MSQQTQMVERIKKRRAIFWRALYDEIFPKTVPRPPSNSTNIVLKGGLSESDIREIKLCPSHVIRAEFLFYSMIHRFHRLQHIRMCDGSAILMKCGPDTGFNIYGPIMFPSWARPRQVIRFDDEPDSESKRQPSFL